MRPNTIHKLIIAVLSTCTLQACLPSDNAGTTESTNGSSGGLPPDFVVVPDPGANLPTPTPDVSTPPEELSTFILNNGEDWTALAFLDASMNYSEAKEFRLDFGNQCPTGAWVPMQALLNVQIPDNLKNTLVEMTVQFRDFDSQVTPCMTDSILHDDKGPDILFTRYPLASIDEGVAQTLSYEVTDPSGVNTIDCSLNNIVRPCVSGRADVQIPGLEPGNYTFTITATDIRGFQNQSSVSWTVTSLTKTINHTINISEYRKWDILFVIDNSGSMEYEQKNMGARTKNFLSVLRGLDWQIAVTTTDPNDVKLGDGRFIAINGGDMGYLLNSQMDEAEAQAKLSHTLQRPETGSGSEQGIRSTFRVVDRSIGNDSVYNRFFRDGAHFAVVLISDEDESANTNKNDPESLLKHIQEAFHGQKNFLFNSIITIPGDTACRQTNGYAYGDRYKIMSNLTGGIIGSVCESDYAGQVSGIADKIRGMAQSLTLSCVPLAGQPITILRDGVPVNDPYTVNGVTISFQSAVQPGKYDLTYKCLN